MKEDSSNTSKTALCITTSFPPYGGSGGQRMVKFCKYFGDMGWNSTVITRRGTIFETTDESLMHQIPDNCKVYWTKSLDPAFIAGLFYTKKKKSVTKSHKSVSQGHNDGLIKKLWVFFRTWFLSPHPFWLWIPFGYMQAKKVIRENDIKVVFADSRISSILALLLSRKFNIPYIVDYRNAWVNDPHLKMPTAMHRKFNIFFEKKTLRHAAAAVFLSSVTMEDTLRDYLFFNRQNAFLIPNGYDGEDFPENLSHDYTRAFTIGYIGSIYSHYVPAFRIFCKSLKKMLTDSVNSDIRFQIVGRTCKEVQDLIEEYGLCKIVSVEGYLAHTDAIKFLLRSHVLLLILDEPKNGQKASVPGKLYEYMASMRKILFIGPSCETSKIIEKHQSGLCAFMDTDKACQALQQWKESYDQRNMACNDLALVESFERRALTKKLVDVFETVLKKTKYKISNDTSNRLMKKGDRCEWPERIL